MKSRLSILIFVLLFSCSQVIQADKYTKPGNVIIEGKGIDSFLINATRADDVIKKLGKNYEEIKHKEYSVQMVYKELGLSFYYYPGDPKMEIFTIVFTRPFEGRTTKGIALEKSTMEDVVKIYGEPDWTTCEDCDTWTVEYEGIQFDVERDKSLPQFPLDEAVHLKRQIVEISVIDKDE